VASAATVSTATVIRQTLDGQTKVSGTLGYAGNATASSPISGKVTWTPAPGATVQPGQTLFRVNDQPVVLWRGALSMWRDLSVGVDDGPDVLQLERNLVALGYDPGHRITVDRHFTAATAAAVKRWQKALGLDQTGTFGQQAPVVFLPWAARVASVDAGVGAAAGPGAPVLHLTSTVHRVAVDLDVTQQIQVKAGDRVDVELPDGRRAAGKVTSVGTVATTTGEAPNQTTTIPVTVALDDPRAGGGLDQSPVDVWVTTETARDVLAVPVTALLALSEGGYAVEVVDQGGGHRLVGVQLGLFAKGLVQVSGADLREGMKVVTAQ
jgi:peptidoglycan hydrolase-like protein with peptidoglycan-binding domain